MANNGGQTRAQVAKSGESLWNCVDDELIGAFRCSSGPSLWLLVGHWFFSISRFSSREKRIYICIFIQLVSSLQGRVAAGKEDDTSRRRRSFSLAAFGGAWKKKKKETFLANLAKIDRLRAANWAPMQSGQCRAQQAN